MTDMILSLIAVFVIGAIVGWKVNDLLFKITFGKMLSDAGVTDKDLEKFVRHWAPVLEKEAGIVVQNKDDVKPEVFVKIEQHHGALYAFRKDNDKFLGQGATREELIERLKEQFEGEVTVTVKEEDGAEYMKAS